MTSATLFDDQDDARRARDLGIGRVRANNETAMMICVAAIRRTAAKHDEFTTEDVWNELGIDTQMTTESIGANPKVMGPAMNEARALGICEPTDTIRNTKRVSRHAAPMRVWRSK